MKVKHSFHSPIRNGTDPNVVKPSHWNTEHVNEAGEVLDIEQQGPPGIQGVQGDQGDKGDKGDQG